MSHPSDPPDYNKVFEDFWRELVCDADGNLDEDKVKRELADYHFLLEQVPEVYGHVSGGRISKPNTYAFEVTAEADKRRQEWIDEAIAEAIEEDREARADGAPVG